MTMVEPRVIDRVCFLDDDDDDCCHGKDDMKDPAEDRARVEADQVDQAKDDLVTLETQVNMRTAAPPTDKIILVLSYCRGLTAQIVNGISSAEHTK
jgi:hypothetical protein